MLNERDDAIDNELIEEVDDMQISDVVEDWVGFKDVENAWLTLEKKLEKKYWCYTSRP